jgi:hypothetical protein
LGKNVGLECQIKMNTIFTQVLSSAAKVSNEWSLVAFALGVLLLIISFFLRRSHVSKTAERLVKVAIVSVIIIAALPFIGRAYSERHGVYRIRITVENPQGMPINDAKVTSSIGGEPKVVEGGWEFDIPPGSRPDDGRLMLYATVKTAFLSGHTDAQLASDYNLTAKIRLEHDRSAHIRGQVLNKRGYPVDGAQVNIAGYSDGATTDSSGQFDVPAHAADGEQVELHVFKNKLGSVSAWEQAGGQPVTVDLGR